MGRDLSLLRMSDREKQHLIDLSSVDTIDLFLSLSQHPPCSPIHRCIPSHSPTMRLHHSHVGFSISPPSPLTRLSLSLLSMSDYTFVDNSLTHPFAGSSNLHSEGELADIFDANGVHIQTHTFAHTLAIASLIYPPSPPSSLSFTSSLPSSLPLLPYIACFVFVIPDDMQLNSSYSMSSSRNLSSLVHPVLIHIHTSQLFN